MTFYLKYRSQTLDQLDLEKVREQLQNIVSSGRVPHALLFAGPRGAGKTSAARILAKVVNCEGTTNDKQHATKGGKIEPCNKCESCISITKGSSLDVVEIDAASNRGVDDIRTLRETIKLSPISSSMKVYIIDEAHMLTTEASNALLKTLEEPPAHAMFILATTAPDKLLDTIRSRSTLINFYKGTPPEIVRSLNRVVEGEKLKLEAGVLEEIASSVDGSFREAHKTLEQLSFGVKEIKLESVKNLLSLGSANPQKLISFLAERDVVGGIREIGDVGEKGTNLKAYGVELVRLLRESMFAKLGVGGRDVAEGLRVEDLRQLIELFSEAARQIPTAVIPQLPLELVVVKWGEGGLMQQPLSRSNLNSLPDKIGTDPSRSRSRGPHEAGLSTFDSTSQDLAQTIGIELAQQPAASNDKGKDGLEKVKGEKVGVLGQAELEEKWREIMRRTKAKNHSLEALLRACKPIGFDGKNLKVEVFYPFHKEKLEKENYRSIFEKVASDVIGGNVRLESVLSSSKKRAVDVVNLSAPKDEDLAKVAEEIFGGGGAN